MASPRNRRRERRGAASTETILTVTLVAVGCLAVVTVFGRQIAGLFGRSTDAIGTGQVQAVQAERPADYSALNASSAGGGSAGGGGGGGGDPGAPGVSVPSGAGSGAAH
ncbi:MAG: hypothetical protein HZA54_07670, partial [Planctomycetes bacterium]|nr:hypothetical protein [Planctomycetota bacterium]